MHLILCKNCEHTFQGNYCPNCGQKSKTERLSWNFVQDELKYVVLHFNKGLLFTAKELLTRPGDTIREFIEGKRINHYKPILLVFVLAGINGLLTHYLSLNEMMNSIQPEEQRINPLFDMTQYLNWFTKNYAIIELLLIPVFSLCSWLSFKKWGYNYIENVIINCFASGQRLLLGIIFFPLSYLLDKSGYIFFSLILSSLVYLATLWTYSTLYRDKVIGERILRILLFIFLLGMLFIVACIILALILVLFIKR